MITKSDGATPATTPSPPSGAYDPADLQSAYRLPSATAGSGKTVAIVDAYDNPNAAGDLAAYRSAMGQPPLCSGCFQKVNQSGQTSPLPSTDVGWGQEIDIDIQMASAVCPNCKILLIETNSNNFSDLLAGIDRAVTMGANAISNSWGGSEFSSETSSSYESHFNKSGVAITVSSGDNGYKTEYPAASKYVTAVGGTSLNTSSSSRGWSESAWSGAGSGCSKYVTKPSWQHDTGCSRRTIADVSAVANPNTGVAVYDTYGSGSNPWYVFGGTSVASPIIAATFAMGGASSPSTPYGSASNLYDVTSGSNGSCGTYLCQGATGYDGPTGLGTPNATGAFGGVTPAATTTTSTSTTSTSTTSTSTTSTTTPPAGQQLVGNSGFETGSLSPWAVVNSVPAPTVVTTNAHTGSHSALLGRVSGTETSGNSSMRQDVSIPAGAHATLSFWYLATTTDVSINDWQTVQIKNTSGTILATIFKSATTTPTWTLGTKDVSQWAGQTIRLFFNVHENGNGQLTSMYVDDVTVTTS